MLLAGLAGAAGAQETRTRRRESNGNRKARIARTIEQTYGYQYEAAGGGGYERYRSGQYLQQNNEVTFWASTQYRLNDQYGLLGEVRGAYGKAKIGNTVFNIPNPQISQYNFMVGPSYRLLKREKFGITGFVEGGVVLGKFGDGAKGLTATDVGLWPGDYAASFSAGANFDYNFYPNLAFRVTPTYLGTTFGSTVQNSKGLNLGFVYRFGKGR